MRFLFFITASIACLLYSKVLGLKSLKTVFSRVKSLFKSNLGLKSVPGYYIAKNPVLNKGKSFTLSEQEKMGLRGLYPAGESLSLELKVEVAMEQLRKKTSPLEKYIHLHTIQDSDETLYYAILSSYTTEVMPIVYTPTVGEACIQWNKIFRHTPRGLYLSIKDKGQIRKILDNYPQKIIKAIVFTDGERILGLGDLGANGMGIPIGKLALYTTCAGIDPSQCLPVHIDVGTENQKLLDDPSYMGLRQKRVRGAEYNELIDEFFTACHDAYGRNVLMQFEDFGNTNAFGLLEKFKDRALCFNDDIQGTASVVLAGVIASLKLCHKSKLSEHVFMFYGAGEAGVGIANLIASSIQKELKCSEEESRKNIWLFDSKGLVSSARTDKLAEHKKPFAHTLPAAAAAEQEMDLLRAVQLIKPSALVGVSAQGGAFTESVCGEMAKNNEAPLILGLSNPTSKAECTAEQAYTWTHGRAVYFSGSPFDPVTLSDGSVRVPGQGNNAYIFPGVGLGGLAAGALTLTDGDFTVAAECLAEQVSADRLAQGCAYPPIKDIRQVSLRIAAAVARSAISEGRCSQSVLDAKLSDQQLLQRCADMMYTPKY